MSIRTERQVVDALGYHILLATFDAQYVDIRESGDTTLVGFLLKGSPDLGVTADADALYYYPGDRCTIEGTDRGHWSIRRVKAGDFLGLFRANANTVTLQLMYVHT